MNLNDPRISVRLLELIAAHNIEAFIETGTGYAVSLEWADDQGLRCYSCDVEEHQVIAARERFPNVTVWCEESVAFLEYACKRERAPSLFWLDAHDAAPEHGTGPPWPAGEEVATIAARRSGKDVILMDDITDVRFDVKHYTEILADTHNWDVADGVLWIVPK